MNIISNNCIGGFVYRDILHTQYTNPFIWTAITDNSSFLKFCENFDKIDFQNVSITTDTTSIYAQNKTALLIDDQYILCFHHVWHDSRYKEPTLIKNWGTGINVCCDDPAAYIKNKYFERLSRMSVNDKRLFMFYDAGKPYSDIIQLETICKKQNAYGIILTSENLQITENRVLLLKTENSWAKGDWAPILLEHYTTDILQFINKITS